MTTPPIRRLSNITLTRSSTQPVISHPQEFNDYNALVNQSPIHLHDSGIEDHDEHSHRPPLLASQRNQVHSLQTIPQPIRPSQSTFFTFRQESMRGSRMLRMPSVQEVPESNGPQTRADFQTSNNDVVIPIEPLDADDHRHEPTTQSSANQEQTTREENGRQEGPQNPQDERIKKAASFRLRLQFLFNILALLCYTMGYLYLTNMVSINAIFGVTFALIALAYAGPLTKKGLYSDFDSVDTLFSLTHLTCLSVYIGVAFLKTQGTEISLTQFALLGLLILFCSCCKNGVDEPSASKAVLLLGKVFLWVQLVLVAIRVDGLLLPWGTVFIPTYFGLVLLAFSSALIILGSLFAFINIMKEEGVSAELVVGSVWYILNALYAGVWLLLISGLTGILDEQGDSQNLQIYLKIGMAHSGILMLFTLILWRIIFKFQEFEVQSEMLVEEDTLEVEQDIQQDSPSTRIRFQVSKEEKTHLAMISSTFYKYLEKHMNNANPKAIKNEIEQAKARKASHGLKLDVPLHTDFVPSGEKNYVFSPDRQGGGKHLDFSEGDIKLPFNIELPQMKRGESNRSNDNSCIVCFDNAPNAVFMDCGHGGVCYECALESWKKTDNCLFCRQSINKVLKIVHCKPLNITKVVESTTKVVERV